MESFSKIVAVGYVNNGPQYFKVYTKSGQILYYGSEAHSKIEATDKTEALNWLLDKIEDRMGNIIQFTYEEVGGMGIIKKIRYGANQKTNQEHIYEIIFDYVDGRPDQVKQYLMGSYIETKYLLDQIHIKRINQQSLYHYKLDYKMNFHPRLEHVWLYEGSGTTNFYNPTVMEWGSFEENGFEVIEHNDGFQFGILTDNFFLDINGDGLTDKIAVKYQWYQHGGNCAKEPISWNYRLRTHSNGFSAPVMMDPTRLSNFFSHLITADFNGDGLDDFAYVRFNHENKEYTIVDRVGISNGNGFDIYILPSGGIRSKNYPDFQVGDFDGNGKAELMLVNRESAINTNNVFVYSFNDVTHTFTTVLSDYIDFGNTHYDKAQVIIGDFDGDGRSDLMRTARYGGSQHTSNCFIYRINLQNGVAEYLYGTPSNGYPTTWHQVYTGDFNGDGITDILTYNYTDPNPVWEIGLFTGTGFISMAAPDIGHFDLYNTSDAYVNKLILADFDNNSTTDILILRKENNLSKTASYSLYYSNGKEFGNTMTGTFDFEGGFVTYPCYNQFRRESVSHVMDFNGDGYADFYISRGVYNDWVYLHDPSNTFNRVLGFTNGLGSKSSPEYMPLTNPLVYSKDNTALYPLRDIQPAIYVVSAVRREKIQTENPSITERYFYTGAKVHMQGKGFLGFTKRTMNNLIQNTTTEEVNFIYQPNFEYFYPYNVYTKTTFGNSSNGFILAETSNLIDHKANAFNQKVCFPFIKMSIARSYEYSSQSHQLSTKKTMQYDDYGNLILLTELSDSLYRAITDPAAAFTHEKTIETGYLNDDNNWLFRPEFVQTSVRYHTQPNLIHRFEYQYYSNGHPSFPLLKTVRDCPKGEQQNTLALETAYEYDAYGNLTKQSLSAPNDPSTPFSRTIQTSYGAQFKHRLPTSETNAMGDVSTFVYDDLYGRLLKETDPNGLESTHANHPLGIESWVTMPDGIMSCKALRWVNNHPDAPANATFYGWTKSSDQAEQLVFYHKSGAELRQVSTGFDGTLIYTDTEYDSKNRIARVSTPYFKTASANEFTEYSYDVVGRKQSINAPDGTTTSYVYDNLSLQTTVSDGNLSQSSKQFFNAAGWLSKSVDAVGTEVNYHYFSDGKLHQTMVASLPNTLVTLEYNDRRQRTLLNDPNYGQMSTIYNAFDEPLSHTNPKGQTETYSYDLLGRMINRTDVTGTTTWTYNNSGNKKGTLASVSMNGHTTSFAYDDMLRLQSETENIQGQTYTTQYTYDGFGRTFEITYPSGYKTRQHYNSNGYLERYTDAQNNQQLLLEIRGRNALGQLMQSHTGNGYTTYNTYHPLTYRLNTVVTARPDKLWLQDMEYTWTSFGNLESRKKWLSRALGSSVTESFGYDNLNRLDWIKLNNVETGKHTYDEIGLGNITYKKADGTVLFDEAVYGQNNAGPHALTAATTSPGIFPPAEQRLLYNAFDKVTSIIEGDKSLQITYGHHRQRISQQYIQGSNSVNKLWAGACEYITKNGQQYIHTYLSGPLGLFAIHIIKPDGTEEINYIHTDHLGSWNTITDESGNLLQELSFDAWGNRRDPATWRAFAGIATAPLFDRGFTGHEHLYAFNLINMNGRMYDPVVSRMLSPDNYIQAPDFSQSFNRYSYCLNNPLIYTDPSGELYLIDDLIVGGVGFAFGYVSYGLTHGDWGWKAVGAGGIGAGVALLSYYTAGGFSLAAGGSLSGGATFASNYAISSAVNSFMPGVTVPITDNFSVSMSMGLGVSSSGLGAGFNVSGNYSNGDFAASLGYGAGEGGSGSYSGYGGGIRIGDFGAGYYRTSYSGANSQVVGGVSLSYKNVSFRLENDFFGDRYDRWRSNAAELTIGDFVIGTNLYNNDVWEGYSVDNPPPTDDTGMLLRNKCNRAPNIAWKDGQTFSSPLWVGFKANGQVYRFGYSHPMVQDRTQNVIHKWFGPGRTNFFNKYDYFQYGTYNYFGYYNPYSLW